MRADRLFLFAGALSVLCVASTYAADREVQTFGEAAPSAQQVEKFLFPEDQPKDDKYTVMGIQPRPTGERAIGMDIKFHTGSAELTPQARAQLDGIGKALASRSDKLNPGEIIVEGHTDAVGSAEFNKKLSQRRAASVAKHLVTTYGVNAKAIQAVGRGKEDLKDASRPDSEVNRRVELVRRPI